MRVFGLIGYPLKHSFSEKYFTEKFRREKISDAKYFLFPISSLSEFHSLRQRYSFAGLNVTIPFKQSIISHLDELDEKAAIAGAVNTIKFLKKDNLVLTKGYNTDIDGFEALLAACPLPKDVSALILGTGGASKAVAYVLKQKNIAYHFVSRNPDNETVFSYNTLSGKDIAEHELIINTTPLGMFPDVESFPAIPYGSVSKNHLCIDLVYNPEKTVFMARCEQQQALVVNGLEMLWVQAEKSWEIWNQ